MFNSNVFDSITYFVKVSYKIGAVCSYVCTNLELFAHHSINSYVVFSYTGVVMFNLELVSVVKFTS